MEPKLEHVPCPDFDDRGRMVYVYALYKLSNGGFGFEVMGKRAIDSHAEKYSRAFRSEYSPWKTDIIRAISNDNTVKLAFSDDMLEVANEVVYEEESE